jgi:hypothetical protein
VDDYIDWPKAAAEIDELGRFTVHLRHRLGPRASAEFEQSFQSWLEANTASVDFSIIPARHADSGQFVGSLNLYGRGLSQVKPDDLQDTIEEIARNADHDATEATKQEQEFIEPWRKALTRRG